MTWQHDCFSLHVYSLSSASPPMSLSFSLALFSDDTASHSASPFLFAISPLFLPLPLLPHCCYASVLSCYPCYPLILSPGDI